jgi:alkyl sulfatase BDS1-like metallo-beta-lactamase superfamily hydrolase
MSDGPVDVTVDPAQIVASLAALPERRVEELMRGPAGRAVLSEIFRQMRDNFQPESAKGEDALVRFVLTGHPDGADDTYELHINDGVCTLTAEFTSAVKVKTSRALTITMDRVRFVLVLTGRASGTKLYLQRKIKIDGDLKFGGRVIGWFGVASTQ